MVFSTRPLHKRWGKLNRDIAQLALFLYNLLYKSVCVSMHSYVSAKPDKYLSATLRILLWIWLKLTSRNWAWRSSSSSWVLVFGWTKKEKKGYIQIHVSWITGLESEHSVNRTWFTLKRKHLPYFFSHHLQEDLKNLVTNCNHTLHHTWIENIKHWYVKSINYVIFKVKCLLTAAYQTCPSVLLCPQSIGTWPGNDLSPENAAS